MSARMSGGNESGRPALLLALLAAALAGVVMSGCSTYKLSGVIRAEGNDAFAAGEYETALEKYRELKRRDPRSPKARYEVSKALLAMEQPLEAANEAEIAIRLEPGNDQYAAQYTAALSAADEEEELFSFLRQEAVQSGHPQDYVRLGEYLLEHGRPDEARDALLRAAEVDAGRSVEPQMALAEFYREVGDEQREAERLRAVLYLDEDNRAAQDRLQELGHASDERVASVPPEAAAEGDDTE